MLWCWGEEILLNNVELVTDVLEIVDLGPLASHKVGTIRAWQPSTSVSKSTIW